MLIVENLNVTFGKIHAVKGICFQIAEGESVGIVGESGAGKTTAVQAINHLSSGKVSGSILFNGKHVKEPNPQIGMVFQDPTSALNPTMKIGAQIAEGLIYHKLATKAEAKKKAAELLDLVGIQDLEARLHQYPHQLSGGMRQRVLIAIALACRPRLLIADEPTTALDRQTQDQIINLIQEMQKRFRMSLLLVSHDLSMIERVCQRVLTMHAGKIIESGKCLKLKN